jgi:anti-sigma factor RsiW
MNERLDIHALADEQLSAEDRARLEQKLAECETSRRELEAVRALKNLVQTKCEPVTCQTTWARCQDRLREIDKTSRIEGFVGRFAWAFCSLFLVMIVGAGLMNRMNGRSLATSDVPQMASTLTPWLTQPASTDQQTQTIFVDNLAKGAPVKVRPRSEVLILRGARGVVDGRTMVRLDMQDANGIVSLIAVQEASVVGAEPIPGSDRYQQGNVPGKNCITWQDGDYTVVLTSNRSVPDLIAFADNVVNR